MRTILFVASGLAALSPLARANQSYITAGVGGAQESHVDLGVTGQYGFTPRSGLYAYAEGHFATVPVTPHDSSLQYLGELGFEGLQFGAAVRFEGLTSTPNELAVSHIGGGLRYRILTGLDLTERESLYLSKEDKEAVAQELRRKRLSEVPTATVVLADYDIFTYSSPGLTEPIRVPRLSGGIRWIVRPWLTIWPALDAYVYPEGFTDLPPSERSILESRNVRTTRYGPKGPRSGLSGPILGVQRITTVWGVRSGMNFELSASRFQTANVDSATGFAFRASVDQLLKSKGETGKEWRVQPSYEHVMLTTDSGTRHVGFFAITLTRAFNPPYVP